MHQALVNVLLFVAIGLALVCCLGVAVMRDAYQKLHYPGALTGISAFLIVIAVFLQETDFQARVKSVLVFAILFATNAVLTHATARAKRVRDEGWDDARRREAS